MRIPFLQVIVDDSRRHGRALAALDVQKRDQRWWRGLLEDLWDFGVKASGDGRPDGRIKGDRAPELLAAGVEYPGAAEELVKLLEEVGVLECWSAGGRRAGVRVKGVAELYGPAWDRKKQRSELGSKLANRRWKNAARIANGIANVHAETETETDTEREEQLQTMSAGAAGSSLKTLWNEVAHPSLPRCQSLTKKRTGQAASRLKERPLEEWRSVILKINESPFLLGGSDSGWRASFDWLLHPDTATKVLEGKYDRGTGPPVSAAKGAAWTQPGATTWTDAALAADPYEALRGAK